MAIYHLDIYIQKNKCIQWDDDMNQILIAGKMAGNHPTNKIKIHVNKLVGFWLPGSNFADAQNGLTSNVFHVLAAALPLNKNQLGHHQHTFRSQIVQVSKLMDPSQGHLL